MEKGDKMKISKQKGTKDTLAGGQPFQAEARQQFLNALLEHALPVAGQGSKAVVIPQYHAVVHADEYHRQGIFRISYQILRLERILNQGLKFFIMVLAVYTVEDQQDQRHAKSYACQDILSQQHSNSRKQRQRQNIHAVTRRSARPSFLFISSPPKWAFKPMIYL